VAGISQVIFHLMYIRNNQRPISEVEKKQKFNRGFNSAREFIDLFNNKFDIVVSKDCFEHYADPEAMIMRMKDYLLPVGILNYWICSFMESSIWRTYYLHDQGTLGAHNVP
jgi:2-polyprenyl-3-methyl-5-hydroxy-6-metoxy-1,4-benzoquinol methylase